MSFNTDRQSIEQFFVDNFTENLRFEGHDYQNELPPFIGVIVDPTERLNNTLGNTQQIDGSIIVRVFTNRSDGTKAVLDLCDQIATKIDNMVIDGVTTYAVGAPVDLETEDLYLAKEISIPYYS